jgi:hypothetical protein
VALEPKLTGVIEFLSYLALESARNTRVAIGDAETSHIMSLAEFCYSKLGGRQNKAFFFKATLYFNFGRKITVA